MPFATPAAPVDPGTVGAGHRAPMSKLTWNDMPPPGEVVVEAAEPVLAPGDPVGPVGPVARSVVSTERSRPLRFASRLRFGGDSAEDSEEIVPTCQFDAKNRQLINFRLPDLQGQPFLLENVEANHVILIFWGSWCEGSHEAIAHLNMLQERFGPDRLQVLGIAHEPDVAPKQRLEVVAEAARKLNITFPVLLGAIEGPSPLEDALKVQNYPTILLLDHQGVIRWRESGSTPQILSRLDRALAAGVNR